LNLNTTVNSHRHKELRVMNKWRCVATVTQGYMIENLTAAICTHFMKMWQVLGKSRYIGIYRMMFND
jgi:hypothetical protein